MDEIFESLETRERMGSGYSIKVTQTPQGTRVYAKVGRDTDIGDLGRQLQHQYPGAEIEIEVESPLSGKYPQTRQRRKTKSEGERPLV